MASELSEKRRDHLTREIQRLEAELSAAKLERRAIEGGFGRGRSQVDRASDAEIAERYRPIAGRRDLVGQLARELGIKVHQLSRIAKRDAAFQAKNPKPPQAALAEPEAIRREVVKAEPPHVPSDRNFSDAPSERRQEEWNCWFEAVNFASRTLVGDLERLLRKARKREWPEVEAGIPMLQNAMMQLQALAQNYPSAPKRPDPTLALSSSR